jgi:uncharacterized SAM-binding protein YcdF (DUF218 family)
MHVLLSPLTWGILLLCWQAVTQHRGLRRAQWLGVGACLALATPLGANTLVWWIENTLPNGSVCEASETGAPVVVLAGGFVRPPRDANDFAALSAASLQRLSVGLEVAAREPTPPVIFSGGAATGSSEAAVMAALAVRLGLAPSRVRIEARSANTWENAQEVSRLAPVQTHRVQLITSALHAPRATLALNAHGLSTCRHPADSAFVPMSGVGYFIPQISSLAKAESAIHELLGLLNYTVKARSSP